jgi:hypothetical protein
MKIRHFYITTALLSCLCLSNPAQAGFLDWFYGESWNFMEAVGGISIGTAYRTSQGTVYLPINCDVSGLTEITKKPTLINSAIVVDALTAKVRKNEIMISVETGLAKSNSKCTCDGVDLGDVPAGQYEVLYYSSDREKHKIGTAIVPQSRAPKEMK